VSGWGVTRRIQGNAGTPRAEGGETNPRRQLRGDVGVGEGFHGSNDVQVEQAAEEILGAAMNMIHNSVDPYVECLLPETVTTMMNELAALLAARLESSIGRMKYSQQGILALDKIVRGISNELIAAGGSEIRTNFAKVNTMIAVLSCDDVGKGCGIYGR